MKKLFLASCVNESISKFIQEFKIKPDTMIVAFIPTAANLYKNKDFIEDDKKAFQKSGFKIKEIDIKGKNRKELSQLLKDVDIIHVTGGNTFYLLQAVKETGFDKIIKDHIKKGKIYTGSSAGAVLVAPTVEPIKYFDSVSQSPELKSFKALNIIDFLPLPHIDDEDYKEGMKKIFDDYSNKFYKIVSIKDNQAIIVKNNQYKIV